MLKKTHLPFKRITTRTTLLDKLIGLGLILLLAACSSSAPLNDIQVMQEVSLDNQLAETSGLFCQDEMAYTVNDSGNSPILFATTADGVITTQVEIAGENTDWEAVTADEDYFYIGDFGNNAGKRLNLRVLKVDRKNMEKVSQISITYDGYNIDKNAYYAHDFDAEAMVSRDNHLVLFSKSWSTHKLKIYFVDKNTSEQKLIPVSDVSGLPGVVTGADWDEMNKQYVLVGYSSNAQGIFKPFVATLSEVFELTNTYKLDGFGQVEGLCVASKQEVWLTQESSHFSSAKLIKIRLPE